MTQPCEHLDKRWNKIDHQIDSKIWNCVDINYQFCYDCWKILDYSIND